VASELGGCWFISEHETTDHQSPSEFDLIHGKEFPNNRYGALGGAAEARYCVRAG
jgi:hypothetical protein